MAGRKRHSAEDIVRKLRRADDLAAEGKTGEEIAAELGVSAGTLYNWRRAYGGMDDPEWAPTRKNAVKASLAGATCGTGLSIASVADGCLLGVFLPGTCTRDATHWGAATNMV
jgi:hypothetical protein